MWLVCSAMLNFANVVMCIICYVCHVLLGYMFGCMLILNAWLFYAMMARLVVCSMMARITR